jgi:hypothetical protein
MGLGRVSAWLAASALWSVIALGAAAGAPERTIDMSHAFDSGVVLGSTQITPTAPDPPPLTEREQWLLDLRWDRGEVWLLGARRADMGAPRATPRTMGRFALELYEGPVLIERVRFDFPLLGAEIGDVGEIGEIGEIGAPPLSLSPKLRTRVGVLFPATLHGTRLELWDRASDVRWSLPWPPLGARVGKDARDGRHDGGAAPAPRDASADR